MAAAPAAIEMLENEAWIPLPTPLAVLPTFFNALSCLAALFSASRAGALQISRGFCVCLIQVINEFLGFLLANFANLLQTIDKILNFRSVLDANRLIYVTRHILPLLLLVLYESIRQFLNKVIHVFFGWFPHGFFC